jgi:hypothetical protein
MECGRGPKSPLDDPRAKGAIYSPNELAACELKELNHVASVHAVETKATPQNSSTTR